MCQDHVMCLQENTSYAGNVWDQERDELVAQARTLKFKLLSQQQPQKKSRQDQPNYWLEKLHDLKKPETPLIEKGEKLVVTEFALAYWTAQSYNLDLNDWPKKKPDHFPKETYEYLKRLFKPFTEPYKPAPGDQTIIKKLRA